MSLQQDLNQRWARMQPRERAMVGAGAAAVALVVFWLVGIKPAWTTWKTVPAERRELQLSLLDMQRLANESRDLKAQPPVNAAQAAQALQSATDRLGSNGKLSQLGDRATLTISGVSPEALRTWLSEVRSGARARPVDMTVNRADGGLTGQVTVTLSATP